MHLGCTIHYADWLYNNIITIYKWSLCGNVFTVYPQYWGNKDMYIQMNKRTPSHVAWQVVALWQCGGVSTRHSSSGVTPLPTTIMGEGHQPPLAKWRSTSNYGKWNGTTSHKGKLDGSLHLSPADGKQPPIPLYNLHSFSLTLSHLCLHLGEHYPADTGFEGTNFLRHKGILSFIIHQSMLRMNIYWREYYQGIIW